MVGIFLVAEQLRKDCAHALLCGDTHGFFSVVTLDERHYQFLIISVGGGHERCALNGL